MSLVKCTICGAIFEDDLLVCPVCGQGPAFFVPVAPEPDAARHDSDRQYLILGGGAAGLAAAEAIRERDATGRVTIVTDEDVAPYNRPMLTKTFDAHDAGLPVHPDDWYQAQRIEVLPGATVDSLDAGRKAVTLVGGRVLSYDVCVYALGAYNFVPPMPGADLPEVFTIRSTRDIRRIRDQLDSGKRRVVVIGGGVLGLEAAWALQERSCQVTVVEAAPRVMARQLDEEASVLLAQVAEREGIRVITGGATEAMLAGENGHVAAVRLADGTLLDADLVVLSIGVRANTAVAQAAGAAVERGVIVDDHMRTSLPDVYACGDCAQPPVPSAQLWPVAAAMGRVAGANAAGDDLAYEPCSFAVTFHGMHTALYADGDVGTRPETAYRVEVDGDPAQGVFEKRYYDGDRLCGVILMGDIRRAVEYADRFV